jgi:hypothetical protein
MTVNKSLWALFVALMAATAIYAEKDDSQFVPGKLVYVWHKKTTVYTTVNSTGVPIFAIKGKTYTFVVKIGETLYTGAAEKGGRLSDRLAAGISGVGNFNEKDWAKLDTDDVLVRFEKKGIWAAIAMTVKQPNGKQNTMYLMSIVGPDRKEQCGKRTGCTGHNWDQVPHPSAAASAAPAQ